MKLLILGGTIFLGRALVEAALVRGHKITLFNRGRHHPEAFPQVEKLRGDRDGDLSVLAGRQWDAVIDTSGYLPRVVAASATLLADQAAHYTFISSISVYQMQGQERIDETTPVMTLADPTVEEVDGETYGPLKALSEQAVEASFPERTLIIRPGLIAGPHDRSDRFSYWVDRVARGGTILAPGSPQSHLQLIDVRDLAEWILHGVEQKLTGVYNATGPEHPLTMQELLLSCQRVSGSRSQWVWLPEAFLLEQGVQPWIELPLWLPTASEPAYSAMSATDCQRALAAGLRFRSLDVTVADTLAWLGTRPAETQWQAGLAPEREAELLARWQETQPGYSSGSR